MRQVVCAPPAIEIAAYVRSIADGGLVVADPSRALCEHFGYQTLYEIPRDLQKRLRRQLMQEHAEALEAHPDAVFDHSILTWLADWMRWLWGDTPAEEWEAILREARPAIALSERIHHVARGNTAGYDGYRWLDARNADQIERLLRSLYVEFDCQDRVILVERSGP